MNAPTPDEQSLSADLSALRAALREIRAPDDEPVLRSAARVRAAADAPITAPAAARRTIPVSRLARIVHARPRLAVTLAAAAAVVAVAVLVVELRGERAERPVLAEQAERVAASPATAPAIAAPASTADSASTRTAFRPISFSRSLSSAESYSVVRVRLELATSVPGPAAPGAAIEADLLIGEDGLARAIRFDSADTLPVYGTFRPVGGERR